MLDLMHRPRRLRRTPALRDLVAETRLSRKSFIQPLFTVEDASAAGPIASLPGVSRDTLEGTVAQVEKDLEKGLQSFLLFGIPSKKDLTGKLAQDPKGIVQRTIGAIKKKFGDKVVLAADVCLCEFLEHGHCGIVTEKGEVKNDVSAQILADVARSYADAGVDIVAPSDMMDGRIGAMRETLDEHKHENTIILSYAVKYASTYYGPFHEAAGSAPAFGDRRSYQMDWRNGREAFAEVQLDLDEGADMVMVKPALAYLDVIHRVRQVVDVPLVAYNVSGEYAAVKLLAEKGLADATTMALENLHAIRRAGADLIITYHARELAAANAVGA